MYAFLIILLIFISCGQSKKQVLPNEVEDTVENVVDAVVEEMPKEMGTLKFSDVMGDIKEKRLPIIDTTNFDRFIDWDDIKDFNAQTLSIEKIYPDFYSEAAKYQAMDLYKVEVSPNFYTVVMTFRKGDFEMESTLVNYDVEGSIIDHQLVAFDEILEGKTRVESRISEHKITAHRTLWTEKREIVQEEYRIEQDGKIVELDSSSLSENLKDYTLVLSVLNGLGLHPLEVKTALLTSKVNPQDPNEVIMAIPQIMDEGEHYFELNSYIVIVDNRSGKIRHKYYESAQTNQWVSDAIALQEIKIDTAPYLLSQGKRAFGIRLRYHGMSHANPYEKETLSLFAKRGHELQKILSNYGVLDYGGEWDTDCQGEFHRTEKTLMLLDEQTNGRFNFLVNSKITQTVNEEDGNGECISKETISTATTVLKYNGKEYKNQ